MVVLVVAGVSPSTANDKDESPFAAVVVVPVVADGSATSVGAASGPTTDMGRLPPSSTSTPSPMGGTVGGASVRFRSTFLRNAFGSIAVIFLCWVCGGGGV